MDANMIKFKKLVYVIVKFNLKFVGQVSKVRNFWLKLILYSWGRTWFLRDASISFLVSSR